MRLFHASLIIGENMEIIREDTWNSPDQRGVVFRRPDGHYAIELQESNGVSGAWRIDWRLPAETSKAYFFRVECSNPAAMLANHAIALAVWLDATGLPLRSSYLEPSPAGIFSRTLACPDEARAVRLELSLRWLTGENIVFRMPECQPAELPARPVRVIVTKAVPDFENASITDNLRRFGELFEKMQMAGEHPDLVVFPENFLTRGCRNLTLSQGAQTVPGPLTDFLGKWARKLHTNIVTSLWRTDNRHYYNTAVVIDRSGQLIGTYDKVHLTVNESKNMTAGRNYPVFELDFGKLGVLICWDLWFPEAARELRLGGAEIIAYPIAATGNPKNWDIIWPARCLDNQLYLATAISGDNPCPARVIDPAGDVLAETTGPQTYAAASIDLSHGYFRPSLSVGKGEGELDFYLRERRPETYRRIAMAEKNFNLEKGTDM